MNLTSSKSVSGTFKVGPSSCNRYHLTFSQIILGPGPADIDKLTLTWEMKHNSRCLNARFPISLTFLQWGYVFVVSHAFCHWNG